MTENKKPHFNLYYIFEEDKMHHPLPEKRAEEIRKRIFDLLRER